jgi:Holliday junction resolvase RusA-like endonuclease
MRVKLSNPYGRDMLLLSFIPVFQRVQLASSLPRAELSPSFSSMVIQARGTPRPQPRPRFYRGKAVSCADKSTRAWIDLIHQATRQALQANEELKGPVFISLEFRFGTAQKDRHGQAHLATPDADNLAKLALDCFQRAGALRNDSAVWKLSVIKTWSSTDLAGMTAELRQEAPGSPGSLDWPQWLGH